MPRAKAAPAGNGITVQDVTSKVSKRIAEIKSKDKITPWNKAKLLAFNEVHAMLVPPPPPEEAPAEEA